MHGGVGQLVFIIGRGDARRLVSSIAVVADISAQPGRSQVLQVRASLPLLRIQLSIHFIFAFSVFLSFCSGAEFEIPTDKGATTPVRMWLGPLHVGGEGVEWFHLRAQIRDSIGRFQGISGLSRSSSKSRISPRSRSREQLSRTRSGMFLYDVSCFSRFSGVEVAFLFCSVCRLQQARASARCE